MEITDKQYKITDKQYKITDKQYKITDIFLQNNNNNDLSYQTSSDYFTSDEIIKINGTQNKLKQYSKTIKKIIISKRTIY